MFGQIFSILVKNGEQEEASPQVTESPNLALSGDLSCQVIRLRSMVSKPVLQGLEELLVFSQLSAFLISVFFFSLSPLKLNHTSLTLELLQAMLFILRGTALLACQVSLWELGLSICPHRAPHKLVKMKI